MIVYHGTDIDKGNSIIKNGFDPDKIGSNWGSTLGKGIYFSPEYLEAKSYGNCVIKCFITLNKSLNFNSNPNSNSNSNPNSKIKFTKRLKKTWYNNYDSLIDKTGLEIVIPINKINNIQIIGIVNK